MSPAAWPRPVPGLAQSLVLSAVFYGVSVGVALPLELLKRFAGLPVELFASLLLQQLIAWPITMWIGLLWAGASVRETFQVRRFPVRIVPALLVASFGVTILLLEAASWIPIPEFLRDVMKLFAGERGKLTFFLPVVVVAPVAEELFFRGQVLRGYLARYSVTKAVWASAALFAVFHLNPWQGVVALPLGLGYAWLVVRTGSVLPGMVSHAMVNFSTNFLLPPLGSALGYPPDRMQELAHFPPAVLGIGVAATLAGCGALWRQLSALPPSNPAAPATDPEGFGGGV